MTGFWDHFNSYKAAPKGSNAARMHLERAASFPPQQALLAIAERARLNFAAGDLAACWTDLSSALGVLDTSPQARWVRNEIAFLSALCRYDAGDSGADSFLQLIPADHPFLLDREFQGATMARLETKARGESNLLIERYLATKHRLHVNNVSWPSLLSNLLPDAFILQVGAMDGIRMDPLHETIIRLNSPGVLIEPIKEMFDELKQNYATNTRLRFANVAIGETSGPQIIYRVPLEKARSPDAKNWFEAISTLRRPHPDNVIAEHVVPETINVLSFADFCNDYGVQKFDLLQIDTEGYDWKILRQIDLPAFGCQIVRLEFCHLPIADRIAVVEHLETSGLTPTCDDAFDIWAAKQ